MSRDANLITLGTCRRREHLVVKEEECPGSYPLYTYACGRTSRGGSFVTMPIQSDWLPWYLERREWCPVCKAAVVLKQGEAA